MIITNHVQINPLHGCHILTFDQENLKSLQKDSVGMKSLMTSGNDTKGNLAVKLANATQVFNAIKLRADDNLKFVSKKWSKYVVELKKRVSLEDDLSQKCRN